MSFPSYPSYKPSGIPWAVELPRDWHHASLRWLCRRYAGGTPNRENPSFWEDGAIPWLNSGAVNQRLITQPSEFISDAGLQGSSARWVPEGALVLALAGQGKTKGMVAQTAFATTCNQSMAAIVPSSVLRPRYLYWWLEANYQNIRNLGGGDLRDGLNLEMLGSIACPIPPDADQAGIAAFLDRETAKIDALVAEQERLIELLKEKRQAAISHAVTKGLNPDAPMTPSGVEWLGDVPRHWTIGRIRTFSSFVTSGPRGWSERVGSEGALFIQSGNLTDDLAVDFAMAQRVGVEAGAEATRTRLANGDVVVCITGAKTGNVAVCDAPPEPAYVNQHLCLVRPLRPLHPRFLGMVLKSQVGQTHFETSQYGLKQGLSLEDVKNCPVALPPLAEQQAVVRYVDAHAARVRTLTTEAERAISLLIVRRAALVSAAVTGQIDLRGLN